MNREEFKLDFHNAVHVSDEDWNEAVDKLIEGEVKVAKATLKVLLLAALRTVKLTEGIDEQMAQLQEIEQLKEEVRELSCHKSGNTEPWHILDTKIYKEDSPMIYEILEALKTEI